MASIKDKLGRPTVVVTGLGVVTSLGVGKSDNWSKLTTGQSGIRAITRFPTDGLRTRIAGTIDYLPGKPCSAELSERYAELAAEEAVAQSGIAARGDFPGPLFLAVPPIEIEWPRGPCVVSVHAILAVRSAQAYHLAEKWSAEIERNVAGDAPLRLGDGKDLL